MYQQIKSLCYPQTHAVNPGVKQETSPHSSASTEEQSPSYLGQVSPISPAPSQIPNSGRLINPMSGVLPRVYHPNGNDQKMMYVHVWFKTLIFFFLEFLYWHADHWVYNNVLCMICFLGSIPDLGNYHIIWFKKKEALSSNLFPWVTFCFIA